MACPPPLQYIDCILHAGRVMNGTGYDILVLRNDCTEWSELSSEMTQWRFREWQSSLGDRECAISCAPQTWDSDVWWLPPTTPNDLAIYPFNLNPDVNPESQTVYESYVFISAQEVTDNLNGLGASFSLVAEHDRMMQAGAHLGMAVASDNAADERADLKQPGQRHCAGAGGNGIISVPMNPRILVLTLSAWKCMVKQTFVRRKHELVLAHSLSVSCSPGGSLGVCSIGQSCIFIGQRPCATL